MKHLLLALCLIPSLSWAQYGPSSAVSDVLRVKDAFSRKKPKEQRQEPEKRVEPKQEPPKQQVQIIQQVENIKVIDSSDTANELRKQIVAVRYNAQKDAEALQNVIKSQDQEIQAAREINYIQKKQIDSLSKAVENWQEKYTRYELSVDKLLESPAYSGRSSTASGSTRTQRVRASQSRTYITGPRGGCYYINGNGNKTYVDRSMCR